jgi:hypothetical protein
MTGCDFSRSPDELLDGLTIGGYVVVRLEATTAPFRCDLCGRSTKAPPSVLNLLEKRVRSVRS